MLAVGFDDAKKAFLIWNSHGKAWGMDGYGWVAFNYWRRNVRVGYVIE